MVGSGAAGTARTIIPASGRDVCPTRAKSQEAGSGFPEPAVSRYVKRKGCLLYV